MERKRRLTARDLEIARKSLKETAKANGITEKQMRAEIKKAMRTGMENPDPAVKKQWEAIPWRGPEPTVEEFVAWMTFVVEGRGGKLDNKLNK